jgi:hypothetical protein
MANQQNIARLAEIQEQIKTLCTEGMKIADEEQVTFYLGDAAFAGQYGSGGMEYIPNGEGPFINTDGDTVETGWGDNARGMWMASNSWGC